MSRTGSRNADIAVLLHENESFFSRSRYLVRYLAPIWRDRGLRVAFSRGPRPDIRARIALLHVALTTIPAEYRAAAEAFPVVLNRGATDVSKSRISRQRVRAGSAWHGPVIVKSQHDFGGGGDTYLTSGLTRRLMRALPIPEAVRDLRRRLAERHVAAGDFRSRDMFTDYPVFDSIRDVPSDVFENDALVAEKFVPETEGGLYVLRKWIFFGSKEICLRIRSANRIIRRWRSPDCDRIGVEDELRAARAELALDFGEIDWVMTDSGPMVLDANRPPLLAGELPREELIRLASGIDDYPL